MEKLVATGKTKGVGVCNVRSELYTPNNPSS